MFQRLRTFFKEKRDKCMNYCFKKRSEYTLNDIDSIIAGNIPICCFDKEYSNLDLGQTENFYNGDLEYEPLISSQIKYPIEKEPSNVSYEHSNSHEKEVNGHSVGENNYSDTLELSDICFVEEDYTYLQDTSKYSSDTEISHDNFHSSGSLSKNVSITESDIFGVFSCLNSSDKQICTNDSNSEEENNYDFLECGNVLSSFQSEKNRENSDNSHFKLCIFKDFDQSFCLSTMENFDPKDLEILLIRGDDIILCKIKCSSIVTIYDVSIPLSEYRSCGKEDLFNSNSEIYSDFESVVKSDCFSGNGQAIQNSVKNKADNDTNIIHKIESYEENQVNDKVDVQKTSENVPSDIVKQDAYNEVKGKSLEAIPTIKCTPEHNIYPVKTPSSFEDNFVFKHDNSEQSKVLENFKKELPKSQSRSTNQTTGYSLSERSDGQSLKKKKQNFPLKNLKSHSNLQSVNSSLLDYNAGDLSRDINCLYNYEGELCNISGETFIKTSMKNSCQNIHVKVKRNIMLNTRVGCQVIWRGNTPVPLKGVTNGTTVRFDAIFNPDEDNFQALVIWKGDKPKQVIEPSTRSYIWIDDITLRCNRLFTKDGSNSVFGFHDDEKIFADVVNTSFYIDQKLTDFKSLELYNSSNSKVIKAKISKLMTRSSGTQFKYVVNCIWAGRKPSTHVIPSIFNRDEIYRIGPGNTLVPDKNPICLYCDVICDIKSTECTDRIQFEMNKEKVSIALPTIILKSLNWESKPFKSFKNVKAHITRDLNSQWAVVLAQTFEKKLFGENVSVLDDYVIHSVSATFDPKENNSQNIKDEPLKSKSNIFIDNDVNCAPLSISTSTDSSHIDKPNNKSYHYGNDASASELYPQSIRDATGILIAIKGKYGILKIRSKLLIGCGETLAAFHSSVAYVNQWPLYKDVPLCDQLKDLVDKNWHCSLKKEPKIIEDMHTTYEAIFAWQGRKPNSNDIEYFKSLPNDVFLFHDEINKITGLESFVLNNENSKVYFQEGSYPEELDRIRSKAKQSSSNATAVSSSEFDEFAFDDPNMFPSILATDDHWKEIVEI